MLAIGYSLEAKVLEMIKRSTVTVGLEISTAIVSTSCTDSQKESSLI
jgi:hypothetical protein